MTVLLTVLRSLPENRANPAINESLRMAKPLYFSATMNGAAKRCGLNYDPLMFSTMREDDFSMSSRTLSACRPRAAPCGNEP